MLKEESGILYSAVDGLRFALLTALYRKIAGGSSVQKGMPNSKDQGAYCNRAPRGQSDFSLFQVIRSECKLTQDSKGKRDRAGEKWSNKGKGGTGDKNSKKSDEGSSKSRYQGTTGKASNSKKATGGGGNQDQSYGSSNYQVWASEPYQPYHDWKADSSWETLEKSGARSMD